MPAVIVKHRVADFEKWKMVFDEVDNVRREHSWISYEIFRDAMDPNKLVVVNHVRDLERAMEYGNSDTLRSAMARAGVEGPPEIMYLNDSETKKY